MEAAFVANPKIDLEKEKIVSPKVFLNPTPVAVLLVPIFSKENERIGILTVRRGIEPQIGKLALPGGYLMYEDWRAGALRELQEETGIEISDLESVKLFALESVDNGRKLLVYGITAPVDIAKLSNFVGNEETEELVVIYNPEQLAFPSHTEKLLQYFKTQAAK